MSESAAAETHRTAGLAPSPRPSAAWRVVAVEAVGVDRLHVRFNDGTEGDVDLSAFLRNDRIVGSVFEELRDPEAFRSVTLALGAVQWPNGADLAPDALYDAIRSNGIAALT